MTIGVGFKCDQGIVLSADSQETVGDIKTSIPKLIIRPVHEAPDDKIRAAFVGAGEGPFIDMLVEQMWKAALQNTSSLSSVKEAMEDANILWHEKIWKVYGTDSKARPRVEILVSVCLYRNQIALYKIDGPMMTEVSEYAFVGIGEILGTYVADQSAGYAVSLDEFAMLSLYVIQAAKDYVDGCGGETQFAIIKNNGEIEKLAGYEAKAISEGLMRLNGDIQYLLLRAGTLRTSKREIDDLVKRTKSSLHKTRRDIRRDLRRFQEFRKMFARRVKGLQVVKWSALKKIQ